MKVIVYIAVEDWDGDEMILAQKVERVTLPDEENAWPKVGTALTRVLDECSHAAAQQAMKLAEDVETKADS